jgi:hypothetical protein
VALTHTYDTVPVEACLAFALIRSRGIDAGRHRMTFANSTSAFISVYMYMYNRNIVKIILPAKPPIKYTMIKYNDKATGDPFSHKRCKFRYGQDICS